MSFAPFTLDTFLTGKFWRIKFLVCENNTEKELLPNGFYAEKQERIWVEDEGLIIPNSAGASLTHTKQRLENGANLGYTDETKILVSFKNYKLGTLVKHSNIEYTIIGEIDIDYHNRTSLHVYQIEDKGRMDELGENIEVFEVF